jgi:hypothetical protein
LFIVALVSEANRGSWQRATIASSGIGIIFERNPVIKSEELSKVKSSEGKGIILDRESSPPKKLSLIKNDGAESDTGIPKGLLGVNESEVKPEESGIPVSNLSLAPGVKPIILDGLRIREFV